MTDDELRKAIEVALWNYITRDSARAQMVDAVHRKVAPLVASLRAELAAAKADTERLDWLDENCTHVGGGSGGIYSFSTPADVESADAAPCHRRSPRRAGEGGEQVRIRGYHEWQVMTRQLASAIVGALFTYTFYGPKNSGRVWLALIVSLALWMYLTESVVRAHREPSDAR